jgi:hypothetical protein
MWAESYEARLLQWSRLRDQCRHLAATQALHAINDWWFGAPVTTRTVIWEEHEHWPDPWQLLVNDRHCDLARGLGIMYTVMMMEHREIGDVVLAQTDHDNLVLVDQGKYILNWAPGQLLNIQSQAVQIRRQINSAVFNGMLR